MNLKNTMHRHIQNWQVKNLHVLKAKLGIDDETYALAIGQFVTKDNTICTSSKMLTMGQAQMLQDTWYKQVQQMGMSVNLYTAGSEEFASQAQVDKIRYHAIRCAIKYAPVRIYNVGADGFMEGDELREWMRRRWNAKAALPQPLLRALFEDWINPKSNEFLMEGKFRTNIRVMKVCMYTELTVAEAKYLINRFRAIQEQIEQSNYLPTQHAKQHHAGRN